MRISRSSGRKNQGSFSLKSLKDSELATPTKTRQVSNRRLNEDKVGLRTIDPNYPDTD